MNIDWYELADREARAVCAALPEDLRACIAELAILFDPRPLPDDQVEEGDDENLLGLFVGPSYAEATGDDASLPSTIRLFVENLRDEAGDDPERFRSEIRTTLLHELGHYLGLDEDELDQRGLS